MAGSSRYLVIADESVLPIARTAAIRTLCRGYQALTERLVLGCTLQGDVRKLRIPDLRVFRMIEDSGLSRDI